MLPLCGEERRLDCCEMVDSIVVVAVAIRAWRRSVAVNTAVCPSRVVTIP